MNNQTQEVKEQALVTVPTVTNRNKRVDKLRRVYDKISSHRDSLDSLEKCGVVAIKMQDGTVILIDNESLADRLKSTLVIGIERQIEKELSTLKQTI